MFCGVFLKIEGGIQHWRARLFINMDFKIRRRDGNENVKKKKKRVGLEGKTTTLHEQNKRRRNLFLFLNLNRDARNSTAGGLAYFW